MLEKIILTAIALSGIFFGFLLTFIAPEELKAGKKYFLILKRLIFVSVIFVNIYFLYLQKEMVNLIIITVVGSILLFFDFMIKERYYQIFNYIYFLGIVYLFNTGISIHLMYSLIFIYGLPTGTLLRRMHDGP